MAIYLPKSLAIRKICRNRNSKVDPSANLGPANGPAETRAIRGPNFPNPGSNRDREGGVLQNHFSYNTFGTRSASLVASNGRLIVIYDPVGSETPEGQRVSRSDLEHPLNLL
jgi:hypothetical protein